jgi:hypothetical protein
MREPGTSSCSLHSEIKRRQNNLISSHQTKDSRDYYRLYSPRNASFPCRIGMTIMPVIKGFSTQFQIREDKSILIPGIPGITSQNETKITNIS